MKIVLFVQAIVFASLASASPIEFSGIAKISKIAASGSHTCAITDQGIACWGDFYGDYRLLKKIKNPKQVIARQLLCRLCNDRLRSPMLG